MAKGCDGCSFCCTILAVIELNKPANKACVYCRNGCSIHGDPLLFPPTCRDFECGYLVGQLPDEFRPDRCHVMLTGEDAELQTHFVHVDPAHPYAAQTGVGQQLINIILQVGRYPNILVTVGNKQRVITRDPKSARILKQKLEELKKQNK